MTATTAGGTGAMANRRTVVGVFDGPNHAEQALNELRDAGFQPEQVSVVARDNRETQDMVERTGMGAEGAGTGAVLGGITGGVLGWLVGIGALAIPGIGPIVAAGALATTLGGAAIGAVAGGLIGALVDLGIPEEEARGYEEHVRKGSILLTVSANSDEQARQAHQIFDRRGGSDVRAYGLAEGVSGAAHGAGHQVGAGSGATTGMGGAAGISGGSTAPTGGAGMTGGTSGGGRQVITSDELRDGQEGRSSQP